MELRAILKETVKDFLNFPLKMLEAPSLNNSLNAAMEWLKTAQDESEKGGIPAYYSFFDKWSDLYPEVSGYVIPTFLSYARLNNKSEFYQRAIKIGEWLLDIQRENGSFPQLYNTKGNISSIFNTAQVLQGFVHLFLEKEDEKFLRAADRAVKWILSQSNDDGTFNTNFLYLDSNRTYLTRIAYTLSEYLNIIKQDFLRKFILKNLDWAVSNQQQNGWFNKCGFSERDNMNPLTHTIGYTIEGLLMSGKILEEKYYIDRAVLSAEALLKQFEKDGFIGATYNYNWQPQREYSCLTGTAQIAVIWLEIYKIIDDKRFFNSASALNRYLRKIQYLDYGNRNINGAMKGSYPIYGSYQKFRLLSWATKFFADSLILEKECSARAKDKKDE